MQADKLFINVPCPLCSSKKYKIFKAGELPKKVTSEFLDKIYSSSSESKLFEQVVKCTNCRLTYLNPRLSGNKIIDYYSSGEDSRFISQNQMRMRTFARSIKRIIRQNKLENITDKKILDIGCAGGAFLVAANKFGFNTVGIEPNRWLCRYARNEMGLDVREGDLLKHKFSVNEFDVITLWDVIEHLPNPRVELHEINRILKKDGLLIINYPDYSTFPAKILGQNWPFWLSVHLIYFDKKSIKIMLEEEGYELVRIIPHWQTLELGYALERAGTYFNFFHLIRKIIINLGLSGVPINYWLGQMQVVARKIR